MKIQNIEKLNLDQIISTKNADEESPSNVSLATSSYITAQDMVRNDKSFDVEAEIKTMEQTYQFLQGKLRNELSQSKDIKAAKQKLENLKG